MPTDNRTSELVINKLSKQQYESIQNPSPTELYLVPDDDLREHRSYYTTGTAVIDGDTVDVDIMYEGVAPEGSLETDAVWTITTIVATLGGSIVSTTVDTEQTWDFPTPTPVVPVIGTTPPICYPTTASEVKTTSMLVKSSISDNGKILTENGFVYNTSGNPTISDTKVICDLGAGFFEKKLENLTQNTEYHIKSYGQNSSGLVYGSELVQRTLYNPIPLEYQLVEYLETTAGQYLNLGYVLYNNDRYNFKFNIMSSANTTCIILGAYDINQHMFVTYNTRWYYTVNNAINQYFGSVDNNVHSLKLDENGFWLDDVHISINVANTGTYPLYLGHRAAYPNEYANRQFWYYFDLNNYEGYSGNNKCKLYPVYRIADSKPGMYDIVNNVFYTNQGTGEFAVGPDKEWIDE